MTPAYDPGPSDAELRDALHELDQGALSERDPNWRAITAGSLARSAEIARLEARVADQQSVIDQTPTMKGEEMRRDYEQRLARIAEIVGTSGVDPDDGAVVLVKEDVDEILALAAGEEAGGEV